MKRNELKEDVKKIKLDSILKITIILILSTFIIYLILIFLEKNINIDLIVHAFKNLNIFKFIIFCRKYIFKGVIVWGNILLILACILIIYSLIGRLRLSVGIIAIILWILGSVNHELVLIRATPFTYADIYSISLASKMMSNFSIAITSQIKFTFIILVTLLFILFIIKRLSIKRKQQKILRITSFIISTMIFIIFFKTDLISQSVDWNTVSSYEQQGFLVSFFQTIKDSKVKKRKDYNINNIKENVNNLEINDKVKENEKPNIIVIMNESLSDLGQVYNLELNEDNMPFIHSLTQNTIKGNMHSSGLGCKTANCEFEFLTGDSVRFFTNSNMVAYQNYIKTETCSLASILKEQEYETTVFHPYYRTGYSRSFAYPLLGFERFDAIEDLKNLEGIGNTEYASDLSTYKNVIKYFENKEENKKIFNFTITIQNHTPYTNKKFNNKIYLKNYSKEKYFEVNQYLSVIKYSDEAFKYLVDYFSKVNEKTIIFMFGDHQPGIVKNYPEIFGIEDGQYDEKAYITPYILWANYDIDEENIGDISMNYISSILLDKANLKTTLYNEFLNDLRKTYPIITANTVIDNNNKILDLNEAKSDYKLNLYENIQYNHLFDDKKRINYIFDIQKED